MFWETFDVNFHVLFVRWHLHILTTSEDKFEWSKDFVHTMKFLFLSIDDGNHTTRSDLWFLRSLACKSQNHFVTQSNQAGTTTVFVCLLLVTIICLWSLLILIWQKFIHKSIEILIKLTDLFTTLLFIIPFSNKHFIVFMNIIPNWISGTFSNTKVY